MNWRVVGFSSLLVLTVAMASAWAGAKIGSGDPEIQNVIMAREFVVVDHAGNPLLRLVGLPGAEKGAAAAQSFPSVALL